MTTTLDQDWYLVTPHPEADTTFAVQDPRALRETTAYRVRWAHRRSWPHTYATAVVYAAVHAEIDNCCVVRIYTEWLVSSTTDRPELTALYHTETWDDYPDTSLAYSSPPEAEAVAHEVAQGLIDGTEDYLIGDTLDWDGLPEPSAQVEVVSFGYLHGDPPPAHLVVDVREHFRDPDVDPRLRQLTARDQAVIDRVMATPGAPELVDALVAAATAFARPEAATLRVAIGCAGGRHRSAAIAAELAARLQAAGVAATVTHRDIDRPVVERRRARGAK